MHRIGELPWVLALALAAPACGGLVSRPPTLDYREESVQVEVRFEGGPFNVDFSLARDENERVLGRCRQACKLQLPPGLYRIVAYGDGPRIEKVRLIRHHTRLLITRGSSELRSLGIGLEVAGALGLGTLTVGSLQRVSFTGEVEEHHSGGRTLAIIGGGGAIALGFGLLLHQGARSHFQLTEIEDEPAPISSSTAPVVDTNGVGFSF